jgi:cell division inhibitor SepF
MDELELQDRPGFMTRLTGIFSGRAHADDEPMQNPLQTVRQTYAYHICVHREIFTLEDARMIANGIMRGEQQVVNLNVTEPILRQRIVDFLSGVNYALEGNWEEIGENIYLIAPPVANVEVAPATPGTNSYRN